MGQLKVESNLGQNRVGRNIGRMEQELVDWVKMAESVCWAECSASCVAVSASCVAGPSVQRVVPSDGSLRGAFAVV